METGNIICFTLTLIETCFIVFISGSHSLTLTTNLVGVAPRKVATPQSLLVEFINILQNELDAIDKSPVLKTIELCFSLLRNVSYSVECRATIAKVILVTSATSHLCCLMTTDDFK